MFWKLIQEILAIPVFRYIAHKQPAIVIGYGHANLFAFPYLIIIQLQEQWKGSHICALGKGAKGSEIGPKG